MKSTSLLAAVAVILVANAAALIHAARNRSGTDSEVTLTSRELSYNHDPDDSGVDLQLRWTNWDNRFFSQSESQDQSPRTWLDVDKLQSLGFDCSVAASDPKAAEFYTRQLPRPAFVALEYDGPAWRNWLEANSQGKVYGTARLAFSHLLPIDASRDPKALRARHPDRKSVLILPTIIRIWLRSPLSLPNRPTSPARVTGQIEAFPATIHIPRPLSEDFRELPNATPFDRTEAQYQVKLRYGVLFEPWVIQVEVPKE